MSAALKKLEPWADFPYPAPRKWQARALPRVLKAIENKRGGLVRATTGAGKSFLIAEICRMRPNDRIVVVTPTEQLVSDLHSTISLRCGDVGQFYGKNKSPRRITVVCNPSLPAFAAKYPAPDLILIDEAHESECGTFHDTIEGGWAPGVIVGVTATPWRADDKESLQLFDRLLYNYAPVDAIRDKVVVPPRIISPRLDDGEEINDIMLNMIMRETGPGVVDATNIADAQEFTEILRGAGISADIVHSQQSQPARRKIERLERGEIQVIVHVNMLARGVDIPCLQWLGCRRKVGSRTLFAQYIGRGIRSYPGKEECRVLDPWDLFNTHSLDYEAVLGAADHVPDVELSALTLEDILGDLDMDSPDEIKTLQGVPVRILDPAAAYVRGLRHTMEVRGVIPFDSNPGIWRRDPVTPADVNRIGERMRIVNKIPSIPKEHRRALWISYRALRSQSRGTAQDMGKILKVLAWKKCWPPELGEDVEVML